MRKEVPSPGPCAPRDSHSWAEWLCRGLWCQGLERAQGAEGQGWQQGMEGGVGVIGQGGSQSR
jgi:hypothetical protein